MRPITSPPGLPGADRLALIANARRAVIDQGARPPAGIPPWIERSWRRCLAAGRRPDEPVSFDLVAAAATRRTEEANHALVEAARPVLETLSRAIAHTRYFAILTNADGVVVDVNGPIDRSDRRADLITRIGVDLSERQVGTTAIGAALIEQQPVLLHRGEHFFDDTTAYSCAGAPVFGPDGRCAGMLDLTGIEANERPELRHLVVQSARSIENALALRQPHGLLVRLNWHGGHFGDDADGLVCLDRDGWVTGANPAARQMVPQLTPGLAQPLHCSELFAVPFETFFDAARRAPTVLDVPLWSGLRLSALPQRAGARLPATPANPQPLKDIEIGLIHQAVADAGGNVKQAALALGISRATVYRKLSRRLSKP